MSYLLVSTMGFLVPGPAYTEFGISYRVWGKVQAVTDNSLILQTTKFGQNENLLIATDRDTEFRDTGTLDTLDEGDTVRIEFNIDAGGHRVAETITKIWNRNDFISRRPS